MSDEYDETVEALNRGDDLPDVRKPERRPPAPFVVIAAALLVGALLTVADEHVEILHGIIPFGFFVALYLLDRWVHRR